MCECTCVWREFIQNPQARGRRDGAVVKSTSRSSRGLELPACAMGGSQQLLMIQHCLLVSEITMNARGRYIHRQQIYRHTRPHSTQDPTALVFKCVPFGFYRWPLKKMREKGGGGKETKLLLPSVETRKKRRQSACRRWVLPGPGLRVQRNRRRMYVLPPQQPAGSSLSIPFPWSRVYLPPALFLCPFYFFLFVGHYVNLKVVNIHLCNK